MEIFDIPSESADIKLYPLVITSAKIPDQPRNIVFNPRQLYANYILERLKSLSVDLQKEQELRNSGGLFPTRPWEVEFLYSEIKRIRDILRREMLVAV